MVLLRMPARTPISLSTRRRLRFQALEVKERMGWSARDELRRQVRLERLGQMAIPEVRSPRTDLETAKARKARWLGVSQTIHADA
jgi:hypothetical protein